MLLLESNPSTLANTVADNRRPPFAVALSITVVVVALTAVLRLALLRNQIVPIGYGVPLVLFLLVRSRLFMWITAACFTLISITKLIWFTRLADLDGHVLSSIWRAAYFLLTEFDMVAIASVVHLGLKRRDEVETRNAELEAANREIATREEEIARSNEEMHTQSEELQRQSEELRVANEELADRERTLEVLLTLSRTLTAQHTRNETFDRVCETLAHLIDGPDTRVVVKMREGNNLVVQCHQGFGPDGLETPSLPFESSFASIVLSRGRVAYVADLSQRPDLRVPQPKKGERSCSVLAAPLRVSGRPVGSLEVFRVRPGPWEDRHVLLIESLAAQTSVSLEAAQLFEEVASQRLRFETVLRTVPFGISHCNADLTEVHLNPAGAAMLNVPVDVNLAEPSFSAGWRTYRDGKLVQREEGALMRACRFGEVAINQEAEFALPGGRRMPVLYSTAPMRDASGRIEGAVGAFVEISQQKELQRELDARRREAEEANVRKTRFLAAVSHDIRTPANAISLLAELIRRTASNPALAHEVPDLAKELHGSAQSLVELLGDVMDLARFDSGRFELTETDFALKSLLIDERRRMAPLARQKNLTFEVETTPDSISLRADRIKLSRVVANLVSNAIKFTETGVIRLVGRFSVDGGVEIEVSDTGVGIPPEQLPHIFDEFVQLLNPERDRNKGVGLGLTICQRLVDAMKGRLSVESEVGKGSVFTVSLPPSAVAAPADV